MNCLIMESYFALVYSMLHDIEMEVGKRVELSMLDSNEICRVGTAQDGFDIISINITVIIVVPYTTVWT